MANRGRPKKKPIQEFAKLKGVKDVFELGKEAENLLNNTAFNIALDRLENDLIQLWKRTPTSSDKDREAIYHQIKAVEYFKQKLTGLVNEMIIKRSELEEQQKQGA